MECLWWTPGGSGEEKATNMKSTGTYVVGRDETVGRSTGSTQTYFINDQGLIPTSYKPNYAKHNLSLDITRSNVEWILHHHTFDLVMMILVSEGFT